MSRCGPPARRVCRKRSGSLTTPWLQSISKFLGIQLGCNDGKPMFTKAEQTKAQTFQFYRDVHTQVRKGFPLAAAGVAWAASDGRYFQCGADLDSAPPFRPGTSVDTPLRSGSLIALCGRTSPRSTRSTRRGASSTSNSSLSRGQSTSSWTTTSRRVRPPLAESLPHRSDRIAPAGSGHEGREEEDVEPQGGWRRPCREAQGCSGSLGHAGGGPSQEMRPL